MKKTLLIVIFTVLAGIVCFLGFALSKNWPHVPEPDFGISGLESKTRIYGHISKDLDTLILSINYEPKGVLGEPVAVYLWEEWEDKWWLAYYSERLGSCVNMIPRHPLGEKQYSVKIRVTEDSTVLLGFFGANDMLYRALVGKKSKELIEAMPDPLDPGPGHTW